MKIIKSLFVIGITAITFLSCSKNNDNFSATGKWEGALIDGSNGASTFYGLQLNGDGSLTRYKSNGDMLATGIYTIVGDSIKANYQFTSGSKFSIVGLINKDKEKMTGTWGSGSNPKGLGSWNATKK